MERNEEGELIFCATASVPLRLKGKQESTITRLTLLCVFKCWTWTFRKDISKIRVAEMDV